MTRPPFATIVHYRRDVIALMQAICVMQPGGSSLLDRPTILLTISRTRVAPQFIFVGGGAVLKRGGRQKFCLQISLLF
jgi:hypothetical protein